MTSETVDKKHILTLAFAGLLIGLLLGGIAAGAYATWATGGNIANVGITSIIGFFPASLAAIPGTEPIRTALMIWGGLAFIGAIAAPALGMKRQLSSHGTARWASEAETRKAGLRTQLKTLYGPIYGKYGDPDSKADFLSSRDIPHSMITGPTGSGKTAGVVIPTLLTYPGSIFCLDVGGALFEKTSRRRVAFGDKVFKFAPYDLEGMTHRYNPLQDVAETKPSRQFTEARRLATSFIIAEAGGKGFLSGAQDIFAATALLVIQRGTPTIGAVLDALSEPSQPYKMFQKHGQEVNSRAAKSIFNRMAGLESKVLSSYLSVLSDGGLSVWADPAVRAATSASDFSIKEMRSDPTSIYIIVTDNDLLPLAPLIRLLFQQTIAIMQRSKPKASKGEKYTVLFCLDEFASLGQMEALSSAIATLRNYGGRIMMVIQSLAQLRKAYGPDGADIFLSNCRLQVFWAPADPSTPDYISKAIGDFTRPARGKQWKTGEMSTSYQEREEGAPLIRSEQVRMIGDKRIVVLVQNCYPIIAEQVVYYEDKILQPLFDAQSGPLPEPPVLPDDPLEMIQDPVAPTLPDGGAVNPLAALRPAHEIEDAEVVATTGDKDAGAAVGEQTATGPQVPAPAAEEALEERDTQLLSARDKSRLIMSAMTMAQGLYRSAIKDDVEVKPEGGDADAPEPTGETEATDTGGTDTDPVESPAGTADTDSEDEVEARPRKVRGLSRGSLAQAEATTETETTPPKPDPTTSPPEPA